MRRAISQLLKLWDSEMGIILDRHIWTCFFGVAEMVMGRGPEFPVVPLWAQYSPLVGSWQKRDLGVVGSLSRNILSDISSLKQAASSRSAAEVKIRPSSPNWFSGEIDFCLCNCREGP